MKVLILSDIHGNLPAFETVLKAEKDVDQYICLGDVVNYGPWNNECVDLLESLTPCVKLLGNHEEYYLDGQIETNNEMVRQFFEMTYPNFDRKEKIKLYSEEYQFDEFICKHTINNQYIYPDSKVETDQNCFIGHSHYQFKLSSGEHIIYNAGSVGQNREYINVINYLVLTLPELQVNLKGIVYDHKLITNEMKARGYPTVCTDYYLNKPVV